ncbi:TadE family type IV pilus minor pilin [Quadrisphaera sp. INWT6]|uniref:TadE family type IV pilus minor pilin n=1 Tax=Quadrisphaera sp. INWT6 TaxID=2596917 RepID=UPI001891FA94|nr:TadE family type IV pilus minor pilin [Quadrisphaera sp. INWT6]MBF5081875.1 pilus assembly protein TadE [Quadrisphaera sp. INWT6]
MTRCGPPRRDAERGAVTAELAVGLLVVGVVLVLAGWLAAAGAAQVRVQLAAGAAARALARGEDPAAVQQRVASAVGEGARSERADEAGLVRVRVVAPLEVPVLGARVEVAGEAVAPLEAPADPVPVPP